MDEAGSQSEEFSVQAEFDPIKDHSETLFYNNSHHFFLPKTKQISVHRDNRIETTGINYLCGSTKFMLSIWWTPAKLAMEQRTNHLNQSINQSNNQRL